MTVTMRFLSYLTTFLIAGLLAACGGGGGSTGTSSGSASSSAAPLIALFTTAPATLTVGVGSAQEFSIGGGTSPYTAVSNKATVAIAGVKDARLTLGGVTNGTAEITIRDAAGASVMVSMIVSSGPVRPLYTTATSSVTIAPGLSGVQTYQVGGGAGPYTATSSNTSVASLVLTGDSLKVTGLTAGSTNILVMDSLGATVSVAVTVPTVSNLGFFTTAPSSVTVAIGTSPAYSVGGGTAPYTATSSNTGVSTVALVGSNLTVKGISAGSADIVVRDGAGASVTVAVTVPTAVTVALFTTAPSSVTVAIGANPVYSVGGGTSPYTATSSSTGIVKVVLVGTDLTVTGVSAGNATIVVRDSAGASVSVAVIVPTANSVTLYTTAPSSVTVAIAASSTYGIGGGTGPYTATSSNTSVTAVSLVGTDLKISGIGGGSANIVVRDSTGTTVSLAITVPPSTNVALFTTAPSSITVAIGTVTGYGVGGGIAPYTATSSNASVVVVSMVGNNLAVNGIAAGNASIVLRDNAGTSIAVVATVPTASSVALFTTAPSSVTVAIGASPAYNVGGGTGPYTATTDNATIATASLVGNSLTITGRAVGSAIVFVRDSAGSLVSVKVAVGTVVLAVTPTSATGIINDVLIATITGGTPPFRASVGNILVASASVQNQNELKITLLQVGQTIITVLDANNQSIAYSLTSNAATPGIRLSPNAVTVSEYGNEPILFTVYGAAAGAMNVFSSDVTRLAATLVNQTVTVTTGTNGNRCVVGDTPVTITVVDSTRATGIAIVTIQENGGTCP